ncbi:MAG: glycosyltransferase family 39 protein [Albidovulum sp.]
MTTQSNTQSRILGAVAILAGLAMLVVTITVSDADLGWSSTLIDRWYFSVGAVALMAFGICARYEAVVFGILAFFLIVGGAAQLYVTDPLWFPALHLTPDNWKEWATIGVIAAEALAAAVVLMRADPGYIFSESRRRLGLGRIAIFVLLTGILSVPLLGYVARGAGMAYGAHVVVGSLLILVHLSVLAAMSQVKSPISGLYRLSPLVPAVVTLGVSLILGYYAFERMPHVEDEVAYLFQARTFAGGALTAPVPPEAALPGLEYYLFDIQDGRWFAATAPGWPAVLSLGVLIGAPWLINPLLAALSVLLAHAITSRLANRDHADLVAMMMGSSPWLLAMAASFMTHTLTLTLMLFAWWMLLRATDTSTNRTRRLIIAGLAMGMIFATRPLDGVVIGVLTGLWLLFRAKGSVIQAAFYGLGCVGTGALALIYNAVITGNPLRQPLANYLDALWGPGANAYGFGDQIGPAGGWGNLDLWPGHSINEALINTINLAASLQFDMLGWSVGSLALILAFLLWQKPNRADLMMLAVILSTVCVMFFYWFADSYYIGPRYWFLASFPLFYLSARGYQAIRARFPDKDQLAFVRIDSVFWFACIFGLCVFLPWRSITKYYEYGNYHPTTREDAADGRFDNAVVLVKTTGDVGSALMLNDPWLRGTIYLKDTGGLDDAALKAAFPGRDIIRYEDDWF